MIIDWLWRRVRTPAPLCFRDIVLRPQTVWAGCLLAPERAARVCSRFTCAGPILWIDTSGLCGPGTAGATHRIALDEEDLERALATAEHLAGFDAILVTVATTVDRVADGGDLAGLLLSAGARGRVHLAVVGIGDVGWRDPLLRALGANGLRLPASVAGA